MAHDTHGAPGADGAVAPAGAPAHHEEHHPTAATYVKVGAFLTAITIVEVWAYYIPAWVESWTFIPSLLIMSAVKFATVVMFYMHLKYDHKLFRALFTGPFIVAAVTIVGLMFLFGKLAIRLGLLT